MRTDRSKGRIFVTGLLSAFLTAAVPLRLGAAPEVEFNILAGDKNAKPLATHQETGVAKNLPGRPTLEMAEKTDPLKKAGSDHGKAGQIQISDEITWVDGADKLLEAPSGSVDLRYEAGSGYQIKHSKEQGGGAVGADVTILDAMAEVTGVFETVLGTVDFGAIVEAEAKVHGSGDYRFDPLKGDVGASGNIGAIAGISAKIEGSYETPSILGVKVTASGGAEGYLAAGAEASGEIYWKDGKLNVGGKVGAALGLGGGVGGDVQLDFSELIAAADDAVGILSAKAVAVANNALGLGPVNEMVGGSCAVETKVEDLTIAEPASEYPGIKRQTIRPGELLFEGNTPKSENVKKLVLLIHGWNPSNSEDPFADGGFGMMREVWKANANAYLGWNLALYNWHTDAATGRVPPAHCGTRAAEAAYLHGWYLADEIMRRFPNIHEVQFITHSAGAWVARSAALGMKNKAGLLLQVALLDPYMPTLLSDDPGVDVPDSLTREKMKDMDPAVFNGHGATMVFAECYYHEKDLALGTNDPMPWNSAGTRQANISRDKLQVLVDKLNATAQSAMGLSLQKRVLDALGVAMADFGPVGHAVPVDWYAATMLVPHCQELGWPLSLPFRQVQPSQAATIVAVVDESGSMAGRKIAQAGEGVRMLANMVFGRSDLAELGLVGFNTSSRQISAPVKKDQEQEIARGVDLLGADGNTAIGEGLLEGLRSLQLGKNVAKDLVLLSDGENNTGDIESALAEVEKSGFPVYTVGYDINAAGAQVLQEIAARTGGDFFNADVDNIQQVYASINARIEDRCVLCRGRRGGRGWSRPARGGERMLPRCHARQQLAVSEFPGAER
jgi:Mg-chelatase subunit ChlD